MGSHTPKQHLKALQRRKDYLKNTIQDKEKNGKSIANECSEYNAITWAIVNLLHLAPNYKKEY